MPVTGGTLRPESGLASELVANFVDGEDQFGLLRIFLQFLTQAGDMYVHRACKRAHFIAPYLAQEPLPRKNDPGMLHEIAQQFEFTNGKVDRFARARDFDVAMV